MEWIKTSGYLLSILAFSAATFLLFTTQAKHYIKSLLIAVFATVILWSGYYVCALNDILPQYMSIMSVMDNIKNAAIIFFLTAVLNSGIDGFKSHISFRFIKAILIVTTGTVLFNTVITTLNPALLIPLTHFAFPLMLTTLQLALLEEWYRKSEETARWQSKPLIFSIAIFSIFDFFIYSEALMFNVINPDYLSARGYIYGALVPLILVSIKRTKNWGMRIFISRDIVLQSSMLIVAGGYLILMSLAGFYIKESGAEWSGILQISFVVIAFAILVIMFFSEGFRQTIKVFITKHFFANQFDYRQEWLKLINTLHLKESKESGNFYLQGLTGMIQALNYTHGCFVKYNSMTDIRQLASKDIDTLSDSEIEVIQRCIPYIEQEKWIIDLVDFTHSPSSYPNLELPPFTQAISFDLIIPVTIEGNVIGLFLLKNTNSKHAKLNWELRDYIAAVTAQIGSYYLFNEASAKLRENAQFDAFNRMSAFVVHDLKNVIAQISLILTNAQKHKSNPEFIDDTFETLEHTQARMNKMLEQLLNKNQTSSDLETASLVDVIKSVLSKCAYNTPIPTLKYTDVTADIMIDKEKLTNVLHHLIDNAQQATEEEGHVTISVMNAQNNIKISITDSGHGMTQEFIDTRLFKPFDTTKGNAGMGIGAYDAKNFMEQVGGTLIVESKPNEGSTFLLTFPTMGIQEH